MIQVDTPPQIEICKFMQKIINQVKVVFPHQFKNSECGMFSMLYIINCLENPNDSYHKSRECIGHDSDAHKFRDKLYKPNINFVS